MLGGPLAKGREEKVGQDLSKGREERSSRKGRE